MPRAWHGPMTSGSSARTGPCTTRRRPAATGSGSPRNSPRSAWRLDGQEPARVVHGHLLEIGLGDAHVPEARQEGLVEVDVAVALVPFELGVVADVLAEQHLVRMAAREQLEQQLHDA